MAGKVNGMFPSDARLLVVDADPKERASLCRVLESNQYHVVSARGPADVFGRLDQRIDLVINRWSGRGSSGMHFLKQWKQSNPDSSFLVVSPSLEPSLAVQAMKLGADDYVTVPVEPERLLAEIRACLNHDSSRGQSDEFISGVVGRSKAIRLVAERIQQAAAVDSTVLVSGESGTGKELVANAIHRLSARSGQPMMVCNMAAVPDTLVESELFGHVRGAFTGAEMARIGRFQAADGGTVFLDEVGDVPRHVQAKLLRVLEYRRVSQVGSNIEQPVDVRVIAATHRLLEALVRKQQFRLDLYFRLNVVRIHLPPLRDRKGDIPLLVNYYLTRMSRRYGRGRLSVDGSLMRFLETYSWPGNVRQLKNLMESMVVLATDPVLTEHDIPAWFRDSARQLQHRPRIPRGMKLAELEQTAVLQVLDHFEGNTIQAAASLGVSARTLQRKLKKWRAA